MELITTNEARCRDCYRCIRVCPLKAIRISTGESGELYARVIEELCVQDASCVLACPQKAKKIFSSLAEVRNLLQRGIPVVVSIAPSFAAGFPLEDPGLMSALLRKLGFARVQETSIGAELVAKVHRCMVYDRTVISSACPVVVNLIEQHYPEVLPLLAPVVSPMIAHGRYMKKAYPGHKTVFIGPCAAKKNEAGIPGIDDAIDYVLGFDELWDWVREEGIDLHSLTSEIFDGPHPGSARLFPVEGGMFKTIGSSLGDQVEFISVTGLQNCIDYLKHLSGNKSPAPGLVEMLACRGGCIDGPLSMCPDSDAFSRRKRVIAYHQSTSAGSGFFDVAMEVEIPAGLLDRQFANRKAFFPVPDEQEIKNILEQTGKFKPEDELNCGACGYDSCRDKAVAVYQGLAELQMCIPYMRRRAESMSNLVIDAMPNAVIIADYELVIREANSAALKMFGCSDREMSGLRLEQFLPPDSFTEVLNTGEKINRVSTYPEKNITVREVVFPLVNERMIVGILVDITAEKRQREQFELMKGQTIARAQEVINKQMTVAQEIAGLLGETTAETKVLLTKLIDLMQKEPL